MFNIGDKVRPVDDWHENEVGTIVPTKDWQLQQGGGKLDFETFEVYDNELAVEWSDGIWLCDGTEIELAQ